LHSRTLQFVRAEQGKEPAVEYQVDVIFSLHWQIWEAVDWDRQR
jgi:hypothetical protein